MANSSSKTDPRLNVLHRGAKPGGATKSPIVLVHGAWHGAWCWETHFLDYFADQGFDVHAVDLRGHGDSEAVTSMRRNRISRYVDDVLSVVDGLDRKAVLIGHSMGGFVAQHCMRRSQNLAAVGLLGTVPHFGVGPLAAKIAVQRPLDFIKMNVTLSLYPLVSNPAKAWHMLMEGDGSPDQIGDFAALLGDESYLAFLDMIFLNLPRKPRANLPVLVIAAELDQLFSVASQQATARHYGGHCRTVAGAPHNMMISSQWQQVADRLLDWISDAGLNGDLIADRSTGD